MIQLEMKISVQMKVLKRMLLWIKIRHLQQTLNSPEVPVMRDGGMLEDANGDDVTGEELRIRDYEDNECPVQLSRQISNA